MRFCQPVTSITETADASSTQVSEGLFGERVAISERHGEFCLIHTQRDHYTGYISAAALFDSSPENSTHYVQRRHTPLFSQPDIKSAVIDTLAFGSELSLQSFDDTFFQTEHGQYVFREHCRAITAIISDDPVDVAKDIYLGAPYRWGGRSPVGIDCSGLVQMCAFATGVLLPRDSGPQERFLDHLVLHSDRRRNDLVFWPGHVGLLVDPDHLLHATAHTLLTVVEPLADVVKRAGAISSIRRLS